MNELDYLDKQIRRRERQVKRTKSINRRRRRRFDKYSRGRR